METLEQIKGRMELALPGVHLQILPNGAPSNPASLLVDPASALQAALFLKADAGLRLDYASNVTGVDWPDRVEKTSVKLMKLVEGVEKEVEEARETQVPGFLEVVYHLYSMERKQGPVILRQRTANRTDQVEVASLTPVWRAAEFQEREVFDLFGVRFAGHPDLRRILMWDEFTDFPMRKDYVEPDDYEYEPTPHGPVLEKAKKHAAMLPPAAGLESPLKQ